MSKGKNRSKNKRWKERKGKVSEREMGDSAGKYSRLYDEEPSETNDSESTLENSARREQHGRKLTIYIYKSELDKIKNWVLLYKDIETGGDLFGLWIDSHTAVVQFALGPGKNCTRHTTSFFQDLEYLETAGGYLTQKHGLCNVGQWHSHHQLSLNEPSGGDENTVWGNMPNLGLTRYIVCIANISTKQNSYVAGVNCFLFELDEQREKLPVLKGEFEMLKNPSPVSEHLEDVPEIAEGAEPPPERKDDEEPTPRLTHAWAWTCCRFFANFRSSFLKLITSNTFKAIAIIAGIASPFVVGGIIFNILNKDKTVHH